MNPEEYLQALKTGLDVQIKALREANAKRVNQFAEKQISALKVKTDSYIADAYARFQNKMAEISEGRKQRPHMRIVWDAEERLATSLFQGSIETHKSIFNSAVMQIRKIISR